MFQDLLTKAIDSSPKHDIEKNCSDDAEGNSEEDTSTSLQKEILYKDVHL